MSESGYIKTPDSIPYAKVTVIVEEGDEVRTMTIHKAYNVMTHVNHRDMYTALPKPGALPLAPSKIDFIFEGSAVFEVEKGNFIESKLEKKEPWMEDPLEAISNLHNSNGRRWVGFPRADREEIYCTECNKASPCPTQLMTRWRNGA